MTTYNENEGNLYVSEGISHDSSSPEEQCISIFSFLYTHLILNYLLALHETDPELLRTTKENIKHLEEKKRKLQNKVYFSP